MVDWVWAAAPRVSAQMRMSVVRAQRVVVALAFFVCMAMPPLGGDRGHLWCWLGLRLRLALGESADCGGATWAGSVAQIGEVRDSLEVGGPKLIKVAKLILGQRLFDASMAAAALRYIQG